jgi:hypothetical protein
MIIISITQFMLGFVEWFNTTQYILRGWSGYFFKIQGEWSFQAVKLCFLGDVVDTNSNSGDR